MSQPEDWDTKAYQAEKEVSSHSSALFSIKIPEQYSLMPKQVILLGLEKVFTNTCEASEQPPTIPASELIMMLVSMQKQLWILSF